MLPLQECRFDAWLEDCFPGGSDGKASACSVGDPDAILGSGAAAAAKSLQSCPTLGDPIDGSPHTNTSFSQ